MGLGDCPMTSRYGPLLSKAVGPKDASVIVVEKISLNNNIYLRVSTNTTKQKVQVVNIAPVHGSLRPTSLEKSLKLCVVVSS